jgi:hypothetical protein
VVGPTRMLCIDPGGVAGSWFSSAKPLQNSASRSTPGAGTVPGSLPGILGGIVPAPPLAAVRRNHPA